MEVKRQRVPTGGVGGGGYLRRRACLLDGAPGPAALQQTRFAA